MIPEHPRSSRVAEASFTLRSWTVLGATALVALSVAPPARAGDDFQVNQTTAGNQRDGAAAALADDRFLLSWSGPGDGGVSDVDIWGRLFSSDGSPLAGELIITEPGDADRRSPAAAAAEPDGFIVTWSAGSPQDIRARRVGTSGARLGSEVPVNSYVTGRQANSAVAALGASGFVVAWESAGSLEDDTDNTSVQLRRLDATGTPLAVELQVNEYTTSAQLTPSVATGANGGFVVTWQSYGSAGSDDSSASIQSRRFDSLGDPIGGELQVNQYTTGIQSSPHLTSLDDGRYLVVWRGTATGAGFQVLARPLDSTGQPAGDEFRVSTTDLGDGNSSANPTLSRSTEDGGLVAVWRTGVPDGDGSGRAIAGRYLEADATPLGADFVVNSYTTGSVTGPDVANVGANGWVAIWTAADASPGDDSDPTAVVARLFGGSAIFADDFESGDACGWAVQAPPAACPG